MLGSFIKEPYNLWSRFRWFALGTSFALGTWVSVADTATDVQKMLRPTQVSTNHSLFSLFDWYLPNAVKKKTWPLSKILKRILSLWRQWSIRSYSDSSYIIEYNGRCLLKKTKHNKENLGVIQQIIHYFHYSTDIYPMLLIKKKKHDPSVKYSREFFLLTSMRFSFL